MSKRVTITQVAAAAGVSIKTVSNVLNDTGNMRPQTRARVRRVMDELGYQVNLAARTMRTGATKLLGLGIADFSQPFSAYLTDNIIQAARARGYGVVTSTYGFHHQSAESILPETHKLPADGWIFFLGDRAAEDSPIFSQSYPVVFASEFDAFGKVDSVTMPSYEMTKDMVTRLIHSGKQRIAFAGAPLRSEGESEPDYLARIDASRFGTVDMRTKGYCDALRENGRTVDTRVIRDCMFIDHKNGSELAEHLLEDIDAGHLELPDAIVCANDALAFGVIHALASRGVRIPEDVAIVGFDNVPEAQYSNPTLTTINPHVDDFARAAVDFLIERIEGYKGPVRRYSTTCDLQIRQSAQL
ncbi:LacI family transcriptional regulator [Alloscardovia macacae]|uniref:LacI family transcriptional regulator n=1 Tax=Alloscardovia macacae TaxID=1160091 RepID=A0A1Y2SXU0_9BIFI|nr:LacI family DNA-binding transcriptional regulator [Alloscardovia macacae]OTA26587.1 LacI family transcriptional regulator [Alloscardovia macacae]OTA29025.1 LacI family transcriptional regulator [Alloscardovia macacae]